MLGKSQATSQSIFHLSSADRCPPISDARNKRTFVRLFCVFSHKRRGEFAHPQALLRSQSR